tara:strand:- start:61 stop:1074 length:1014 start_codon:yes stop_codon:yes gene_type:complete
MSKFKINSITDRSGYCGPVIAGVSTNNSTGCMIIPAGPTEHRGGRGRGVIGGGSLIPSSTAVNTLNLITIATTGDATDFGDLSYGGAYRGGLASSTRGIFANASNDETYDYVTISSQGGANDFGEAPDDTRNGATFNNSVRGFNAGGSDPVHKSNIRGMIIASTGSFFDAGDLTQVGVYMSGASSPTRGIIFGGAFPATSKNIDVFTMASGGNAIKFGELITARKYADTTGNTTRALAAGGEGPSANINSIEFVTIATDGNGTDFGDISSATSTLKSGVVSSATRGIFAGFYPASGGDQRMDFVTITSAGNAQDFGDLTTAAYYTGGCSDSNGGLGE